MNVLEAIKIMDAGIALASNFLISSRRYSALIITAREEERDITDEELETLRDESRALFDVLKGSFDDAG